MHDVYSDGMALGNEVTRLDDKTMSELAPEQASRSRLQGLKAYPRHSTYGL